MKIAIGSDFDDKTGTLKKGNKTTVLKYLFRNKGRIYIQKKTVNKCLNLILNILK